MDKSHAGENTSGKLNAQDSHGSMVKLAKPLTAMAREALANKTMKLMRKRARLRKKLTKLINAEIKPTAGQKSPAHGNTGILTRMERLARRERRHMLSRIKMLEERDKLYRWDPTDERALDLDLVRSLLSSFRQVLYSELRVDEIPFPSAFSTEEGTSASILPAPNASKEKNKEKLDVVSQSQSKELDNEREQRSETTDPGKGNPRRAIDETAGSEQESDESDLRYDQLRVKEMLSGLAYDDLVYDAEPTKGKRVIDHGLWMSGALQDVPDSSNICPCNHDNMPETPHSPSRVTTPVKSAIKKNGEIKPSILGRKVTFQENPLGGSRTVINDKQPSSPTYPYSVTHTGKEPVTTNSEDARAKVSKKKKHHTKRNTSIDQSSGSSKKAEKSTRHKIRQSSRHEKVNGLNTPAKNDLVQVLGVTPEVSHLASFLARLSKSAPAKLPGGGSNLDALRREDRIILETERQIWLRRMGYNDFVD
ncbi:hypothetical protein UCRPA7_7186 [Phaeoacremonium minimum UCRPA7]|uniref:Uncharacterized protein n=1 Tax=Phaeoacremonium minimum (strain UCR-PA7) TaxID=1286976 RepID=R8BD85_PHAM7|nr:hypothetical protein UCRPA7_7186 [Phaeoacremonium minimum UCRPA7]EON97252.1 hypothetical protein UCRPA7_7186 [Phaeoacremonium minimum UCRPA7]